MRGTATVRGPLEIVGEGGEPMPDHFAAVFPCKPPFSSNDPGGISSLATLFQPGDLYIIN